MAFSYLCYYRVMRIPALIVLFVSISIGGYAQQAPPYKSYEVHLGDTINRVDSRDLIKITRLLRMAIMLTDARKSSGRPIITPGK